MTRSREEILRIIEDLEYEVSILSYGEDGQDNSYRRQLLSILIARAKEELAQCN